MRLSQEAFAQYLGVAPRTVARWHEHTEAELRPTTSEILDAALARIDDSTRQRFTALLHANGDRSGNKSRRATTATPTTAQPPPDAAVEASQAQWRATRSYLIDSGIGVAARTSRLYDAGLRVDPGAALALPSWLPSKPVPLETVLAKWQPQPPEPRILGTEAEARHALPLRSPGHAFERYSSAIRYLSPPSLFENRHSYRLLDIDWTAEDPALTFGLSTFFDKLDVGEPLAHEAAQADQNNELRWDVLAFRSLIADPFDLSVRAVNPGITTLTIRQDAATGLATFPLLRRNPAKVTNGRHYSLLPAGEFQPASISAQSVQVDLDLWRNIVREYSEEALGNPEHDGSTGVPVDYEGWRFYRDISRARETGDVRVYVLGVVLDALSLNATIVTVAVFESGAFDRLFRDIVTSNPEGDVIFTIDADAKHELTGVPFDQPTIERLISTEPLGQTSAACLTLAWRHRQTLLASCHPAADARHISAT